MKVAWVSNSPWCGTGYGQQTALALPRLLERYGPDSTACLSLFGLQGAPLKLNGVLHYPLGYHPYSDDVLAQHALHHFDDGPGFVITLFDVWIFGNPQWAELPLVASWVPIDHVPVPPNVVKFLRTFNVVPIAMAKWGQDQLRNAGIDALYVPHAIDRAVMKPTPTIHGRPSRRAFGIPEDRYVVGMVSANKGTVPNRKCFPEAFLAFAEWIASDEAKKLDRKPLLYCHTDPTGAGQGIDLYRLAAMYRLKVGEDVMFTEPYVLRVPFQPAGMAALMSSFDVLLQPSMGEGFGIPALEAQACGVPVIGTDFSAQPEVIEAGWVVHGDLYPDIAQDSFMVTPSVPSLVKALSMCAARTSDEVAEMSVNGQAHADLYDVDRVWSEHWVPALDHLERLVPTAAPIVAAPSIERRAA